jgi:hypothetical protein
MKGSLLRLSLRRIRHHRTNHLLLHFHVTSVMMPRALPAIASSPVLRQNWETLDRLALRWSKPSDVDVCPHTIIIRSSVLRRKTNKLSPLGFEAQTNKLLQLFWGLNHQTVDLGFEAQTKKPSQWFWGQTTDKSSPPILSLNEKTHAFRLHHVYDADHTWRHSTSRSSDIWVPDLCLIIPNPPHQVSYSCLDPRCCLPCHIHHLHITR